MNFWDTILLIVFFLAVLVGVESGKDMDYCESKDGIYQEGLCYINENGHYNGFKILRKDNGQRRLGK